MKTFVRVVGISLMWLSLVHCDNATTTSGADNGVDSAGEEAPLGIPANDNVIDTSGNVEQLNVLAYNIYGVPFPSESPNIAGRWAQLPTAVRGYDVVIWSEAFVDSERALLKARLSSEALETLFVEGFFFHTSIVEDDGISLRSDGGVFISSRWPILAQGQIVFDDCYLEDCLAAKGVSYAKINKTIGNSSQIYHVFGTHLQATTGPPGFPLDKLGSRDTRRKQLEQLQEFITQNAVLGFIQPGEPVIIGGDMNVDRYAPDPLFFEPEYDGMLSILNATDPNEFLWRETDFSWLPVDFSDILNPIYNWLAIGSSPELLDYVLYSNGTALTEHLIPRVACDAVLPFKAVSNWDDGSPRGNDLSDHYPVYGYFDLTGESSFTVDSGSVTVPEGSIATHSGTLVACTGSTIVASIGEVFSTGATNSWNWSYPTADGPTDSQTVNVTADFGASPFLRTFALIVNNVAPTAAFDIASAEIFQGESVMLAFSGQTDPSVADVEAGFVYSYDCTNDATFDATDIGSEIFDCPQPNAGDLTARGRIEDKDGGFSDYLATVRVLTPQEAAQTLIDDVLEMLATGILLQEDSDFLERELRALIRNLDRGDANSAIDRAEAVIDCVQDNLIDDGLLTVAQGQPLIDKALRIISSIDAVFA